MHWATRLLVERGQQQIEDSLISCCICSVDPKCNEISKLKQTTQFTVQKHRHFNHRTERRITPSIRATDKPALSCKGLDTLPQRGLIEDYQVSTQRVTMLSFNVLLDLLEETSMDVDARIELSIVTSNDCERFDLKGREASKQFVRDPISNSSGYSAPSASACFHRACMDLAVCYWRRYQFCDANDGGA